METRTFGSGALIIRFLFFKNNQANKVVFKANDRKTIAKILRKYRKAERYLRVHGNENYEPFSYRDIASHFPTIQIFAWTKSGLPYFKTYRCCYHFKGFLRKTRIFIAKIKYGYREIGRC